MAPCLKSKSSPDNRNISAVIFVTYEVCFLPNFFLKRESSDKYSGNTWIIFTALAFSLNLEAGPS